MNAARTTAAVAIRLQRQTAITLGLAVLVLISALGADGARAVEPLGSLGAMRALPELEAREQERSAERRQIDAARRGGLDRGLSMLGQGMSRFNSFREFADSSQALDPGDLEFDPDYEPPGAPSLPVHCDVSGGDRCRQCYDSAYRKINFVRHYLEKLRGIYGATRTYSERAIAFGDSMSGLHGGFGLAWPPERKGIQDAMKSLDRTYDEKYRDYMRELLEGLQELAQCEKQYFGEDDWYSRFGFIYYTYMQDRYRRS
ncbi:hypothetical protein HFP89_02405 [Wenzhouxiangella sp. XN79A]|uniref:hypothetical protein n=1 Tax=Wenzhouxiangella sp. XN79A TaxID=2724193 RepID=UPI00144AA4FE|nr:hypothetical protein [Wenzhouxiangella sp. XN79A]NKI34017.1 hypothetical protein [Wenzhouxiangella sp. XN79A]